MPQLPAPSVTGPDGSFDAVPYEGYVYRNSHPDYLYAIGKLFGMSPPPYETARVLELGCGAGGNLLPLALRFPNMTLTGIDLSAEGIAEADRLKEALELENVAFLKKDIMELGDADGPLDYVLCHGVFSWVPDDVREKILDFCRHALSPQGLALISYNALPGWHAITPARDLMRYHAQLFTAPKDKISQARMMLDFMAENAPADTSHYKTMLQAERKTLSEANDSYVFHDHLFWMNTPFYLHQFAALLPPHGLQYVGDTNLSMMYVRNMGDAAARHLAGIADPIRQEQYMDFLCNRRFRSSIIAHDNVTLNRKMDPEAFFGLSIAANAFPEAGSHDLQEPVVFRKREGVGHFTSTNPVVTAFCLALVEAGGCPVSADDLAAVVQERLGITEPAAMRASLGVTGLELILMDFITLHGVPGEFVLQVSTRPCVYAPARAEAADNPQRRRLTTAVRESVSTDRFTNMLVVLVDGSRDVKALIRAMAAHLTSGDLAIGSGQTVTRLVRDALDKFARAGLLVS